MGGTKTERVFVIYNYSSKLDIYFLLMKSFLRTLAPPLKLSTSESLNWIKNMPDIILTDNRLDDGSVVKKILTKYD
jgi:hypothetical protein